MTEKYMLVRKTNKGKWTPCALPSMGETELGATSEDRQVVERDRDLMANVFPEHTYAVLVIKED